jgi:S-adenosylmethionine:tRNA ribosyltransferase-isomerase
MQTSDFNYHLPQKLIAQKPASPRDHSRLMILDKNKKTIKHSNFFNLPNYLQRGDVLVFNNSKVIKARLLGNLSAAAKEKNIEIFLLNATTPPYPPYQGGDDDGVNSPLIGGVGGVIWQVLAKPGKKLKLNKKIYFSKNFWCVSLGHYDEQTFLVKFNLTNKKFWQAVNQFGHIPTPPYIKHEPTKLAQYQTIYAKKAGSVAAPTAGLHFTNRLINKLKKQGVQIEYVTLHVGLGTFAPVKINDLTKHKMHSELALLNKATASRLNKAKQEGRRIIAVGTTACRVLESASNTSPLLSKEGLGVVASFHGQTNIFIYPPYKFKFVDALITNFHLPKSTLLMLVSAMATPTLDKNGLKGINFILKAYKQAIEKKYRFYSFGDAMFIY